MLIDLMEPGPRAVGELVVASGMSYSATSQHLAILRGAGLVSSEALGRRRIYRLRPAALREVSPPHRMVWSWRSADDPATTRLVIELKGDGQGTRLTLQHTGEADERTVKRTTGGWTDKLGALVELLTTQGDDRND